MDSSVPDAGAGISVSTLSVDTSSSGSSAVTSSPTDFSQRVTVPSVTLSPSAGMVTVVPSPPPWFPPPWFPLSCAGAGAASGSGAGSWAWASGVAGCSSSADAGSAGAAAGAPPSPPSPPMTASSAPTSTVSSSETRILLSTPAAGEGISVSTLSVETSSSGSSTSTCSPSCLSQRVTVPSVTLSPRAGMVTDVGIDAVLLQAGGGRGRGGAVRSAVRVQRLAGQDHRGLADGLGQGRVRVDQLGDLFGQGLPVVDQLRLGDQVTDPAADHVHADDGAAVGLPDQLHRAGGLEDRRPAVAGEVVGGGLDVAVLLPRLRLGEPDRGGPGLGVGDPRDAGVVDRDHRQPGQPLGDEDALAEADVGELEGGDQVADRGDRRHVGLAVLVDEDEAALHGD